MQIAEFQRRIEEIYYRKDSERGLEGTYMWFAEEVGELTRALRRDDRENLEEEFADVLAWLVSLANLTGIDMEKAIDKYRNGCPGCHKIPCACDHPGLDPE